MATLNMAPTPTNIHNPATVYPQYPPPTGSRNTSPISSATATPTNISPTSPRHSNSFSNPNGQPRQLRPPKCPMYVPAVLRPTERPHRHTLKRESSGAASIASPTSGILPITPPRSAGSSFDEATNVPSIGVDGVSRRALGEFGPMPGVSRIITDEWAEEKMEDVTGYPTRDHWKPDSSSPTCNAPICSQNFHLLARRHHCRRCGNIFCSTHSMRMVPLDQHARFHPKGVLARACETCYADFETWRRAHKRSRNDSGTGSVHGSEGSGSGSGSGSGTSTPTTIKGAVQVLSEEQATDNEPSQPPKKAPAPIIGSLSRDWNWSTF